MRIIPLAEQHIEDAAALVARRYKNLRGLVSVLPERYEKPAVFCPLVQNLTEHSPGMVAIDGRELIGFLAGMVLPEFRGQRSVYSPEWANAAIEDRSREVYQRLYSALSDAWVADRCSAHYVSVFVHDKPGIEAWCWQSFGMMGVDAIRNLSPVEGESFDVYIDNRQATLSDVDAILQLETALKNYSQSAPIFLMNDDISDRTTWANFLHNEANCVWLACHAEKPIAFIQVGPANPDACYVMRDPKTASIYEAFTEEAHRSQGVATVLLNRVLDWARHRGYERCAVNFEPMNIPGARFWLNHFDPFCYSMQRIVDDRLIPLTRN